MKGFSCVSWRMVDSSTPPTRSLGRNWSGRSLAPPWIRRSKSSVPGLSPFWGGLIYSSYCMGPDKIKLARRLGVLDKGWDYGYSDSAWDIPLLAHCRHRFLVNPDKKTINRTRAALGGRVTILNWTDTI